MIKKNVIAKVAFVMVFAAAAAAVAQAQTGPGARPTQSDGQPPIEASPPSPAAPSREAGAKPAPVLPDRYVINPLDTLSVTVVGEPDLTNKYKVDIDGGITLPYVGRQSAAGLTISDLQTKIASLLKQGYLQNPQVLIDVDQFKSRAVYVTGKVRIPGKVTINGPSITLMDALALAGSTLADASTLITVQHQKGGELVTVHRKDLELGKAGFDVILEDGDVVNVPGAEQFYISGMVRNSGTYVLEAGMTFAQAIAVAGGLNDRGSDRRITVTRVVNGRTTEVKVDVDGKVQANDTIKIPARFF
jgi:polysaccharide export outer membrane protein